MALDKDAGTSLFKRDKDRAVSACGIQSTNITPTNEDTIDPAKWTQLDKVTVLLTPEQKEGVDKLAKKLMKYRAKELKNTSNRERLTANTIIRALIENLLQRENTLEMQVLATEKDVEKWLETLFK